MPTSKAKAKWEGKLKNGRGTIETQSGVLSDVTYTFATRFENATGTNPEELIGAAHAGCFSMALTHLLEEAGYEPKSVETAAEVQIEQTGGDFTITRISLTCQADVPGIEDDKFQEVANMAKTGCPVSKALAGPEIELAASLA